MSGKKLQYKQRKIITEAVLVAYPNLAAPKAFKEGDKPMFSIKALFDGNDLPLKVSVDKKAFVNSTLSKVISEIKSEAFTPNAAGVVVGYSSPIQNGDEAEHECFFGKKHFNAKNFPDTKIPVVDGAKSPVDPSEIYSGCYCKLQLAIQPWDSHGKKGIRFNLLGIQLLRKGEPLALGGQVGKVDDFETIEGYESESEVSNSDW